MKRYIKSDSYVYTVLKIKSKIEDTLNIYMKFINYDEVEDLMREATKLSPPRKDPSWNVDVQPYNEGKLIVSVYVEIPSDKIPDLINTLNPIIQEFDKTASFKIEDSFNLVAIINI